MTVEEQRRLEEERRLQYRPPVPPPPPPPPPPAPSPGPQIKSMFLKQAQPRRKLRRDFRPF